MILYTGVLVAGISRVVGRILDASGGDIWSGRNDSCC